MPMARAFSPTIKLMAGRMYSATGIWTLPALFFFAVFRDRTFSNHMNLACFLVLATNQFPLQFWDIVLKFMVKIYIKCHVIEPSSPRKNFGRSFRSNGHQINL